MPHISDAMGSSADVGRLAQCPRSAVPEQHDGKILQLATITRGIAVRSCYTVVDQMEGKQMKRCTCEGRFGRRLIDPAIGVALVMSGFFSGAAYADEGGVSYWLPGRFSSLAATPQVPGWSMAE